ncbi:MAG TPA: T9SS type A sorting domain-containing protein [Saprospiraceae bacterium]|nr:T9SS type A sorting domain-containing protein [Saprospiraceae bacterium]
MNRLLLLCFSLFMSGMISAQDKIVLEVTEPANLAGVYNFLKAGFGGELSPQICEASVLAIDSLACNARPITNGASLSGKIAIIARGSCNFDEKCLNAQNAGAIAVIVHNNVAGGPRAMGVANAGVAGQITIPCIGISMEDGLKIRAALRAGTQVKFCLGPVPKADVDLRINNVERIIQPPVGTIPVEQVKSANDYIILTGALAINDGKNAASNAKASVKITHMPSGSVIYDKSSDPLTTGIEPDSTAGLFIGDLDFSSVNKGIGAYNMNYNVSSDFTETALNYDNSASTSFYVSPNTFCKGKWNLANNTPVVTTSFAPGSPTGYYEIFAPFRIPHGTGISIDTMVFSLVTNAPSLADIPIEAYVYKWNDLNTDGDITNDEIELVSAATYQFPSNFTGTSTVLRLNLENFVGTEPHYVIPDDGSLFLASVKYVGSATVFFGFDTQFDYGGNFQVREELEALDWDAYPYLQTTTAPTSGALDFESAGLFNDNGLEPYMGYNGIFWGALATGLQLGPVVNTKDVLSEADAKLELISNPVTTELRANLTLAQESKKVTYSVIDINGRVLTTMREPNSGKQFAPKFDVSELPNGQYILRVQTDKGFTKTAFTVVK